MKLFSRRPAVRRIRLKTEPGVDQDQFIQLPLTEQFDYLDILSLGLSQRDLYQLRSADYGVVAGRVIANEGVGVPNCRVSIFLAAADAQGPEDELLRQRYPWTSVGADDVDGNGRRYNLLPATQAFRGYNGFERNELGLGATPVTPLGSFPEREAVLTDPVARAVHERYYRYTTQTNESGDFVLVGVPVGSYTLHLDADLTDIGRWSYSPAMLRQVLGYPSGQFEDDGRRLKATTDLSSLSHLVSLNARVTVRPLWGLSDGGGGGETLGVTRQDFKLPVPLRPHFTLAGSLFSMGRNRWWGDNLKFRLHYGLRNLCVPIGQSFCLDTSGCSVKFFFCMGIDVKLLPTIEIGWSCKGRPKDKFFFCAGVVIPNILPFFRFEFRDDYCRLNGGKYDSSPVDVINHGATCECNVDAALEHVPDDGLSAALLLSAHRPEEPDLRLFSLTDQVSDEQAARWSLPLDQGADQVGDNDFTGFDPRTSVRRVPQTEYLELSEEGQFILQPFCNRRPMVTREDGRLVDSPDPRKGVMTEFRGYLYVKGKTELDTPPTVDASARLALKVPQSFDPKYNYAPNGVPYALGGQSRVAEWVFRHGLFKAGGLYSVAQRIATRRATLSDGDEQLNDTSFTRKDADGSVYKKGWDIQTGLILYTDTPQAAQDRFPANDVTYLGHESNFARTSTAADAANVPEAPTGYGSGGVATDFDASVYAAGMQSSGIEIVQPTELDFWTQGFPVGIAYTIDPTQTIVANNKVAIEVILLGDGSDSQTTPQYLMFGTNHTLLFTIDPEVVFNPGAYPAALTYTWQSFFGNKPSTFPDGGSTRGIPLDLTGRLRIRGANDDQYIYGVSPAFPIRIP